MMLLNLIIAIGIILCCALQGAHSGKMEGMLHQKLLTDYNPMTRPVINEHESINVSLGLVFQQIIDVDEKNQVITTCVWQTFKWMDELLVWDPVDFDGISEIRLRPDQIWIPDILLYNSVGENFNSLYQANLIVRNTGAIEWLPPAIVKSYCKIKIDWFPFDDQKCTLKFGSWTYGGGFINLQMGTIDLTEYTTNGEWKLLALTGKLNKNFYECCPDPYLDITFVIWIQRRTLYYGFNFIVPCVLIAIMALLDFILPPDSNEKLTLGITIFMSLCFFLLMVADKMPPTSEAIPLIAVYFSTIMIIISASQVFTILVLNFHYRTSEFYVMPNWIRKLFLNWLPWLLMMKRPGYRFVRGNLVPIEDSSLPESKDITMNTIVSSPSDPHFILSPDKQQKSFLSNILDLDDSDLRRIRWFQPDDGVPLRPWSHHGTPSNIPNGNTPFGAAPKLHHHHQPNFLFDGISNFEMILNGILVDVKLVTKRLREEATDSDVIADWQFAAMVLDRLCMIVFSLIFVLATCCIIFSAKQLVV